jgi:hypothetical protein
MKPELWAAFFYLFFAGSPDAAEVRSGAGFGGLNVVLVGVVAVGVVSDEAALGE